MPASGGAAAFPGGSMTRALFINCMLKRSPELSHTQGLIDRSTAIMEKNGVAVNLLSAVDHDIATGVWPDMRQYGWAADDWPEIYPQILDPGSGGPHNDFTS